MHRLNLFPLSKRETEYLDFLDSAGPRPQYLDELISDHADPRALDLLKEANRSDLLKPDELDAYLTDAVEKLESRESLSFSGNNRLAALLSFGKIYERRAGPLLKENVRDSFDSPTRDKAAQFLSAALRVYEEAVSESSRNRHVHLQYALASRVVNMAHVLFSHATDFHQHDVYHVELCIAYANLMYAGHRLRKVLEDKHHGWRSSVANSATRGEPISSDEFLSPGAFLGYRELKRRLAETANIASILFSYGQLMTDGKSGRVKHMNHLYSLYVKPYVRSHLLDCS